MCAHVCGVFVHVCVFFLLMADCGLTHGSSSTAGSGKRGDIYAAGCCQQATGWYVRVPEGAKREARVSFN